jgi:hypothetical protein
MAALIMCSLVVWKTIAALTATLADSLIQIMNAANLAIAVG